MLLPTHYLSASGDRHKVEIADSNEALTKMATSSFDLTITDLHMPGVDGPAAIEYTSGSFSNPSRILMTGCRAPEIASDGHKLRCTKFQVFR